MNKEHIATLLHILDVVRQWPELRTIHEWAMNELKKAQDEYLREQNKPKAVPTDINVSGKGQTVDQPSLLDERRI